MTTSKSSVSSSKSQKSIMQWLSFLIGIMALIISIIMSFEWQVYNGQNWIVSNVIAITFVGFTILIFEVGCGLLVKANLGKIALVSIQKEFKKVGQARINRRYISGFLCIFLSLILESYNVVSIVGAQYNQLILTQTTSIVQQNQSVDTISSKEQIVRDRKKKAENDLVSLKSDINKKTSIYNLLVKGLEQEIVKDMSETKSFNSFISNSEIEKKRLNDLIDKSSNDLQEILDNKDASSKIEKNVKSLDHGTIYQFLNELTGWNISVLQFIFTAFPALFLGVISALSISFFLYGKEIQKSS